MKNIRFPAYFFFLCLLSAVPLAAQDNPAFTIQQVPDPKRSGTGYVSDPGNYLKPGEIAALNTLLAAMEDSTTAQVAVVVLPSIGEENPKAFATELFNTWKIGQAGTDNGLLVLVVMDQRRTEFETGYGLEGILPDILCYRIGMEALVPYFQQGQYGEGLLATIARFKNILENPESVEEIYSAPEKQGKRGKSGQLLSIYVLLNFLFHLLVLGFIFFTLRSKQELVDKFLALRNARNFIPLILFPLPFILIYLWLGRKLRHLRYQPRFSKATGAVMRLVPEHEEDAFLEKGHITEEEIGSADYDVWVTEAGDDILIQRYPKRFSHYSKCPSCKYSTYSLTKTDTIRAASYTHSGLRRETYQCKNCNYQQTRDVVLPKLVASSSSGGSRSGGSWGGSSSWGGGRSGGGGGGVSW
jgi:uncharacterized protein